MGETFSIFESWKVYFSIERIVSTLKIGKKISENDLKIDSIAGQR